MLSRDAFVAGDRGGVSRFNALTSNQPPNFRAVNRYRTNQLDTRNSAFHLLMVATGRPNVPPNPTVCESAVEAPDSRGQIGNRNWESLSFGSRWRSSRRSCRAEAAHSLNSACSGIMICRRALKVRCTTVGASCSTARAGSPAIREAQRAQLDQGLGERHRGKPRALALRLRLETFQRSHPLA